MNFDKFLRRSWLVTKVAVGAAGAVAAIGTIRLTSTLNDMVRKLDTSVNDQYKGVKGTLANINAILLQTGLASDELRRASRSQREYWDSISKDFRTTIQESNRAISTANTALEKVALMVEQVDAETVPAATATLDQLTKTLKATEENQAKVAESAVEAVGAVRSLVESSEQTLAALDLKKISDNLVSTTGSLDKSGQNVSEATGYVRDMLAPKKLSFWRRAAEMLVPAAIRFIIPQRSVISNTPTVEVKK